MSTARFPSPRGGAVRALTRPAMLLLHLVALGATAGAVLLGVWQYDAWAQHRDNRAAELARSLVDAEPVSLRTVITPDEPFPADALGRPVAASGRWLTDRTFFIAGKPHEGRPGYWVTTPLVVCDAPTLGSPGCADAPALLVVRGWSPTPASAPPAGEAAEVTGWLQPGEGAGDADPDHTDRVMPSLRVADALQQLDRDLYSAYAIEDHARSASAPASLVPVTPDAVPDPPASTALRNLLYAVEWWVFGAFAVLVWLRWCRDEVTRTRGAPAEDDPAGEADRPGDAAADAREEESAAGGGVRPVSDASDERERPAERQVPSAP